MLDKEEKTNQSNFALEAKGKTGIRRVVNAFGYSVDGLKAAYTEAAFRQLIWLNSALIILIFVLKFSLVTKMILILTSMLSLIVELFNTGIEAAVDHTSLAKSNLAKRAKDVGSAAQLVAILTLAIMWGLALWRDYGIHLF